MKTILASSVSIVLLYAVGFTVFTWQFWACIGWGTLIGIGAYTEGTK